jgi:hypothetical protein
MIQWEIAFNCFNSIIAVDIILLMTIVQNINLEILYLVVSPCNALPLLEDFSWRIVHNRCDVCTSPQQVQ